jgi:glutamate dehydrogenase
MAQLLVDLGATVIGISDSRGGIYDQSGLDIKKISEIKAKRGSVIDYNGAEQLGEKEVLEKQCDILIPAALENQITKENAGNIKA